MKLEIDIDGDYYKIICKRVEENKPYHSPHEYEAIADGKPLEQEPKTGHWIDDMSLGYHVSICSNCNWRGHGDTCLIYKPKYCPNCGCRMVEPQEGEGCTK